MNVTNPIPPIPDEACDKNEANNEWAQYFDPLTLRPSLVENQNESRLILELRQAAQTFDPVEVLCRSAVAFLGGRQAVATALADLSVAGRAAYANFCQHRPSEADLLGPVQQRVQASPDSVKSAVGAALDRAYQVALALRGTVQERAQLRGPLGWIAVSGEDDSPHRPVNVPSAPYPQYDLNVVCRGIPVQTRYLIASPWPDPSPANVGGRNVPVDPMPVVPQRDQVVIFIPGQDSSAEECLPLARSLHQVGAERCVGYTMIAMDLPCSGYAPPLDHTRIADPNLSQRFSSPVLAFHEEFIIDFVDELDKKLLNILKKRIIGVIGGSLGGNMGMRLGRRDLNAYPWLRYIVAWSPGSIWNSFDVPDPTKQIVLGQARLGMNDGFVAPGQLEATDLRGKFFAGVFDQKISSHENEDPFKLYAQPDMWYRRSWQPCAQLNIQGDRLFRRENYNWQARRWHWRVGLEELLSSVNDPETEQGTQPRYLSIGSNMLLAAGEDDNYRWANIYPATQTVAKLMVNTPGHTLFLKDTGHSIHAERPMLFAREIAAFLPNYVDSSIYANQLSGIWDIWANGFASTLRITCVDDLGNVQGSVFDNLLTGFWDEESRTLTFLRIPNGAAPSTFQVYVGHMFQNQDGGFTFSLAGSFEAFAGTGATAQRTEFGWVAKQQVIG